MRTFAVESSWQKLAGFFWWKGGLEDLEPLIYTGVQHVTWQSEPDADALLGFLISHWTKVWKVYQVLPGGSSQDVSQSSVQQCHWRVLQGFTGHCLEHPSLSSFIFAWYWLKTWWVSWESPWWAKKRSNCSWWQDGVHPTGGPLQVFTIRKPAGVLHVNLVRQQNLRALKVFLWR